MGVILSRVIHFEYVVTADLILPVPLSVFVTTVVACRPLLERHFDEFVIVP